MAVTKLLPDPPAIRAALHDISQESGKLDIAVAFVGSDWLDLLGNFSGQVRVVCWLSSTNTNPYAVSDMLRRAHVRVKQRDSMHAKIYLAPHSGAIVGSANLSKAALNEADAAGQCEAGMLVRDRDVLAAITAWFQKLWASAATREIAPADLSAAKRAWESARANQRIAKGGRQKPLHEPTVDALPALPPTVPARLKRLAQEMRGLNLARDLGKPHTLLSSLDPTAVTPSQRLEVIDCLTAWNKRRWVCDAIEEEPITKVRRGLTVLFDKSKDVRERLDRVERDGLLPGLRIPSLSLLLYWREPELYVPFDQKTEIFLRDFKLRGRGISDGNGTCYSRWLSHATRIQPWLELPTLGHVDRVVTAYRDRFARAG
jgi:hypothetical protein